MSTAIDESLQELESYMDIIGALIANLEPLANASNLEKLSLRKTKVANIESLSNINTPQVLDLFNTRVEQVTPLKT
ncbi:MAG: hypothetical protein K0M45_08850 [Candidatus Paracaedibacteraceae bacterium]|nr:hypothetical protein [Candidatus Paracaedibacteraceae bacterium]